jgi:hypothetical protein
MTYPAVVKPVPRIARSVRPGVATALTALVALLAIVFAIHLVTRPRLDAVELHRLAVHNVQFRIVGDSVVVSPGEASRSAFRWFYGRVASSPILGIANSPRWQNTRTSVPTSDGYLNLENRLVYAVHLRDAQPKDGPLVYQHRDVVVLIDAHTGRWLREV